MALRIAFTRPARIQRFYPSRCCGILEPITWTSAGISKYDTDDFVRFLQSFGEETQNKESKQVPIKTEESGKSPPEKYTMNIDVKDFRPEDIKVKVQGDNLIVEAKREEKTEEEGMFSRSYREFRRTLPISEGVDKKSITSAFSSDGILEIEGPISAPAAIESEEAKEKMAVDVEQSDE